MSLLDDWETIRFRCLNLSIFKCMKVCFGGLLFMKLLILLFNSCVAYSVKIMYLFSLTFAFCDEGIKCHN